MSQVVMMLDPFLKTSVTGLLNKMVMETQKHKMITNPEYFLWVLEGLYISKIISCIMLSNVSDLTNIR